MGGSPPTVIKGKPAKTTIVQAKNPLESYQALAGVQKRMKEEGAAATARLESQVGTPEEIGQRMLDRDVYTAAMQQSSLPSEASASLKNVTNDLLEKAKQRAAAGPKKGIAELAYEQPSWIYGETQAQINEQSKKA